MAEKKGEVPQPSVPQKCWAPLPETSRGYGFHMHSTKKGDLFCYPAGRLVVVRSLKDPSVSDTFWEHKGRVTVAQFSPNGEWVASGDDQGTVLVWSVKTKLIKNTVQACRKVCDLCWSPDGTKIVAVGDGNEIKAKIFSWDSGSNFGAIEFHSKPILSCSYRPTKPAAIVTSSEDLSVNYYNGPPFKWANSIKEFERYPNCVRFSPDGTKFAVCASDPKLIVYSGDKDGKEKIREFKDAANGHKGAIFSFCWSPDGKQILTASSDKTAKIWNVETGTVATTFTISKKPAVPDQQVSCLWHDSYILSVSLSGAINYLDPAKPDAPAKVVQGHMHPVLGLAVDRAHKRLFSTDADGMVAAWSLDTGLAQWLGGGHGGKAVQSCALSADGKQLWTVGLDDKLKITPVDSLALSNDAQALGGQPVGLALGHKDSGLAVVALAQEKAVLIKNSKVCGALDLGFKPTCVAIAPNDSEVAIGGADNKLYLYSVGASALAVKGQPLSGHLGRLLSVQYSADGALLCSTDANRLIFFWKNGTLQNPTGWTFHNAAVLDAAFWPHSGNGAASRLATCSQDQDVLVWSDLVKFEHKFTRLVLAHALGADHVAFVDEKTVLSTGQDRTIKVWTV